MAVSDIGKNARQVLAKRYLSKDANGKNVEDVAGMFRRVAVAVASADVIFDERADIVSTAEEFYALMTSLRFLPNSPTLMNAGRPLGQLSACFVLPVEDSMEGIFEAVKQAALIHKSGGGTGFSFSRLRQNGATVNSTGGVASGPVSFMRVFNMATEAVKQGGTRRGANMGILRVDHPDIEEFIHCKSVNTDITNFNISVGITEAFMRAVEVGEDYELIDPKTHKAVGRKNAKQLFDEIVDAAWHNGEPGIIFLDRLNRDNVVPGQGEIESTNPCGEQPLLPYESCNLGSINLVQMLRQTGETSWEIDYAMLRKTIQEAVHFLDNVIEVNTYPFAKIGEVTRETRKIGLGVMGFADMLLRLGVPYNSDDAVELAENMMAFINIEGHNASKELARARGAFPLFYSSIYAREAPIRNGTITTIAPTGTLSMIGGCSSGVEPVFAYVYIRNIMDGTQMVEVNPVLKAMLEQRGIYSEDLMHRVAHDGTLAQIEELPEDIRRVFVCAHDITPEYHIRMQAAFQHHTDNAVSKTINLSHGATRADVAQSYLLAYHLGCKGVTIYRDGSRGGQVLNIGSVKQEGEAAVHADGVADVARAKTPAHTENSARQTAQLALPTEQAVAKTMQPRPRPPMTTGFTERMKIGCGNLYVTVNYDENGICEVFTSTGKAGGCPSQSEATARLASVALRSGISVAEVYEQLKGIRCPSTVRQTGMSCTSCPDAIAKVLRKVDSFIRDKNDAPHAVPAPEPLTARRPTAAAALASAQAENVAHAYTQQGSGILAPVQLLPLVGTNAAAAATDQCSTLAHEQPCADAIAPFEEAPPAAGAPARCLNEANDAHFVAVQDAQLAMPTAPPTDMDVFETDDDDAPTLQNTGWKIKLTGLDVTTDELRNPYAPMSQNYFGSMPAHPAPPTQKNRASEPVPAQEPSTRGVSSSIATPPRGYGDAASEEAFVSLHSADIHTHTIATDDGLARVPQANAAGEMPCCPECGGPVEHEGGCVICRQCGYSKCG